MSLFEQKSSMKPYSYVKHSSIQKAPSYLKDYIFTKTIYSKIHNLKYVTIYSLISWWINRQYVCFSEPVKGDQMWQQSSTKFIGKRGWIESLLPYIYFPVSQKSDVGSFFESSLCFPWSVYSSFFFLTHPIYHHYITDIAT